MLATLAAGAATLHFAEQASLLRWPAVFALGICVLTFFPLLHETGHRTAFASQRANEVACWLGALMMLQAPSFFREFHWEHHRSTQDRTLDPEIAPAPAILDPYPRDPLSYFALASGQMLMVGKLAFTMACALLPRRIWQEIFPFIRTSSTSRVAWESRVALGVFASVGYFAYTRSPSLAFALLAWPIAHALLGVYIMPEHTGLPNEGAQLERTRTLTSNALMRTLMWNMPYHAEHHAQPGVPYYALPQLHEDLAPELPHVSVGYLAFHADAFLRSMRLR